MLSTWIKEVGDISLLQRFSKSGEVNFSLPDLYFLLLAFALVGILFWIRFLGLRAIFGKVWGTSAIKTLVVILPLIKLLIIWPWTRLLLLLLLRHWDSSCSLLLRWPKNPFAWWSISRWDFRSCVWHQTISRWLHTGGSSRCLLFHPIYFRSGVSISFGYFAVITFLFAGAAS